MKDKKKVFTELDKFSTKLQIFYLTPEMLNRSTAVASAISCMKENSWQGSLLMRLTALANGVMILDLLIKSYVT